MYEKMFEFLNVGTVLIFGCLTIEMNEALEMF